MLYGAILPREISAILGLPALQHAARNEATIKRWWKRHIPWKSSTTLTSPSMAPPSRDGGNVDGDDAGVRRHDPAMKPPSEDGGNRWSRGGPRSQRSESEWAPSEASSCPRSSTSVTEAPQRSQTHCLQAAWG